MQEKNLGLETISTAAQEQRDPALTSRANILRLAALNPAVHDLLIHPREVTVVEWRVSRPSDEMDRKISPGSPTPDLP